MCVFVLCVCVCCVCVCVRVCVVSLCVCTYVCVVCVCCVCVCVSVCVVSVSVCLCLYCSALDGVVWSTAEHKEHGHPCQLLTILHIQYVRIYCVYLKGLLIAYTPSLGNFPSKKKMVTS